MPDKIVENTNFGKAKEKRDGFSLYLIFSPHYARAKRERRKEEKEKERREEILNCKDLCYLVYAN